MEPNGSFSYFASSPAGPADFSYTVSDIHGATASAVVNLIPRVTSFNVQVVSVSNGKTFTTTTARVGATVYTDRSYTITNLSGGLNNGILVRTSQADRYYNTANYFTLAINAPGDVYVLYDPREAVLPLWLRNPAWVRVNTESISITDTGSSPRQVFHRSYPAGQFSLGGNADGTPGALANYFVIVKPQGNQAPIAYDQTLQSNDSQPLPITLSASDSNGDALIFSVLTQPANGILSGTAPHLIYTANSGYVGSDSFTFQANDGLLDSNAATVTINVLPGTTDFKVKVISVSTGKNYTTATAQVGVLPYIDRSYTLTNLSSGLAAGTLIRTSQFDRYLTNADFLTLSVNVVSNVYVCYDKRAVALPSWLDSTWTLTGESISSTDTEGSPLKVYVKQFPVGCQATIEMSPISPH